MWLLICVPLQRDSSWAQCRILQFLFELENGNPLNSHCHFAKMNLIKKGNFWICHQSEVQLRKHLNFVTIDKKIFFSRRIYFQENFFQEEFNSRRISFKKNFFLGEFLSRRISFHFVKWQGELFLKSRNKFALEGM